MKIENVGQLKNLLENLNDKIPVGIYHKNWWNPTFDKRQQNIEVIKQDEEVIGLAIEIDLSHNY